MSRTDLDTSVDTAARALAQRGLPEPDALFLLGTGLGLLPGQLEGAKRLPLTRLAGMPDAWRERVLHAGRIGGAAVWLLEDAPGTPEHGNESPSVREERWTRAFPVWLAAACGAGVLVHTSAGLALPALEGEPPFAHGALAVARDHINTSGRTPLMGLGESKLGPLFPDQTRTHNPLLRARALEVAEERGIPAAEAVVACTLGPAQETPAERRWLARAGAQVAVQDLADPLIAAAHAGLVTLCLVCVTDAGEGTGDIARMVASADRLAPGLEEICAAIGPDIARVAEAQYVEE